MSIQNKKKFTVTPKPTIPSENNKMYFTDKVQDAIIRYNNETDAFTRDKIYKEEIERAFDKMAENVINTFKFPYLLKVTTFHDLKEQVVSFLVMNLGKFSQKNGKAFSYFSVIAKNYLILQNNKAYQEEKRMVSLAETNDSSSQPISLEEITSEEEGTEEKIRDMREFVDLMVEYWEKNSAKHFKKQRDREIVNAVLHLFRRAHFIENYNKKYLYLTIREQTGYKTNYITKVVKKMKNEVICQIKEYNYSGHLEREK